MKFTAILAIVAAIASAVVAEVPQEHSHDLIVNQVRNVIRKGNNNSPFVDVDPIFALLGNAAASNGIKGAARLTAAADTDPDCLQQNIADECIANAKRTGNDKADIAVCIQFRALERNSGGVGNKSNLCTKATPKNPEIANLLQHQDPASDGAADNNKKVELEVAKQTAALGFSAQEAANLALQTATFAPGQRGDPTAKGNSCDDQQLQPAQKAGVVFGRNIKQGDLIDCITQATLTDGKSKAVPIASIAELLAAAGGAAAGGGNNAQQGNNGGQQNNNNSNNNAGNANAGNGDAAKKIADAIKLLEQAAALL
ncbi:hypothetical protein HDU96_005815 [Phlyctochytrium bullatum]|nr:hypothetical protein HDU96_005815 [Phlyctochytrium bullatum]